MSRAPTNLEALSSICIDNFAHGTPLPPLRQPPVEQIAPQIPLSVFNTALKDILSMAFTTCILQFPEGYNPPTVEALRVAAGR